jgi:Helix-turn-helix domain.
MIKAHKIRLNPSSEQANYFNACGRDSSLRLELGLE